MDRVQIKTLAKQQIKGNIGILFVIALVSALISGAINVIPGVGSIASLLITPAFSLAIVAIYLKLAQGEKPVIKDLFGKLEEFWGAFKVQFLVGLFTYLWTLLFIIPGIVKAFSYSQAMYILAENPGMGALEAINRSKTMMNGHKMELFVLELSFIGWHLLGAITLGIAYIWIIPYMSAAHTNFYNSIKTPAEVVSAAE